MVKKLILRKDGVIQLYDIKDISKFNEKYTAISKIKNRLLYIPEKEEQKTEEKLEEKTKGDKITIPKKRIRKQLTKNFRTDEPPYFASIRVMTINPEFNKQALYMAIEELKKILGDDRDFQLIQKYGDYFAFEQKEIGNQEEKILNDGGIYGELFLGYKESTKEKNKIRIFKIY